MAEETQDTIELFRAEDGSWMMQRTRADGLVMAEQRVADEIKNTRWNTPARLLVLHMRRHFENTVITLRAPNAGP